MKIDIEIIFADFLHATAKIEEEFWKELIKEKHNATTWERYCFRADFNLLPMMEKLEKACKKKILQVKRIYLTDSKCPPNPAKKK